MEDGITSSLQVTLHSTRTARLKAMIGTDLLTSLNEGLVHAIGVVASYRGRVHATDSELRFRNLYTQATA